MSYSYDEDQSRRRALWGLLALALTALVVVWLVATVGGDPESRGSEDTVSRPTTSASPGSTAVTSGPASSTATTSATPSPTVHTGDPCPGRAPCAVDGDGGLVAAVNKYRTDQGLPAVPGKASMNAATCALRGGSGSTCVPHYIYTSVPKQDAAAAVSSLAGFGRAWLLDRNTRSIEVGWSYDGHSWNCAVLKSP